MTISDLTPALANLKQFNPEEAEEWTHVAIATKVEEATSAYNTHDKGAFNEAMAFLRSHGAQVTMTFDGMQLENPLDFYALREAQMVTQIAKINVVRIAERDLAGRKTLSARQREKLDSLTTELDAMKAAFQKTYPEFELKGYTTYAYPLPDVWGKARYEFTLSCYKDERTRQLQITHGAIVADAEWIVRDLTSLLAQLKAQPIGSSYHFSYVDVSLMHRLIGNITVYQTLNNRALFAEPYKTATDNS
jgi:hypothetical protein